MVVRFAEVFKGFRFQIKGVKVAAAAFVNVAVVGFDVVVVVGGEVDLSLVFR